jgi:hypothetical protein
MISRREWLGMSLGAGATIGGGIGRLPNEATRKRMVELVDSWPQPR